MAKCRLGAVQVSNTSLQYKNLKFRGHVCAALISRHFTFDNSPLKVGQVVLKGFHRCDRACRSEPKDGEIAVQRQAMQYMGHI